MVDGHFIRRHGVFFRAQAGRAQSACWRLSATIRDPGAYASMRTSAECLAKARALVHQAAECPAGAVRDAFVAMAIDWRKLALLAARQDALDPI